MKSSFGFAAVVAVAGAVGACSSAENLPGLPAPPSGTAGQPGSNGQAGSTGQQVPGGTGGGMAQVPVTEAFVPTADQTLSYMRYIGPALLGRVLSDAEEARILSEALAAVRPLVEGWVFEDGFTEAVRGMMEVKLGTNGMRGTADFGLAGYLVRHVVANKMPWSTIVTSNTCYSADDRPIPCDTGAPFTAGVLTTKGFLVGTESRFNLNRARSTLLTFMCRDYPHEKELQPDVERSKLKLMFRASNAAEQMVAEVAGGFGNGLQCFSCHSQFSNHAQPFVKFNNHGEYVPTATGLQGKGQLGASDNDLMASHFEEPAESASEKAQWFGEQIENLAGGAAVMARHDKFRECAVQQLLDMGVGLDLAYDAGVKGLVTSGTFLTEIASAVKAKNPDPTIQELAVATYSDVRVIAATLNGLKR